MNQAAPCAARRLTTAVPTWFLPFTLLVVDQTLPMPRRNPKYTTGPTASATGPQISP
jgi:hypothetical protein